VVGVFYDGTTSALQRRQYREQVSMSKGQFHAAEFRAVIAAGEIGTTKSERAPGFGLPNCTSRNCLILRTSRHPRGLNQPCLNRVGCIATFNPVAVVNEDGQHDFLVGAQKAHGDSLVVGSSGIGRH
jgi:hypothetical protein